MTVDEPRTGETRDDEVRDDETRDDETRDGADPGAPGRSPRALIAGLIGAVLLVLLVLGPARAPRRDGDAATSAREAAVALPPTGTRSSAWVCAGVPAADDLARRLVLANLGTSAAPVEVTALLGVTSSVAGRVSLTTSGDGERTVTVTPSEGTPARFTASSRARLAVESGQTVAVGDRLFDDERRSERSVGARSVERIDVGEFTRSTTAALLVQPFASDVVVEQEVTSADDVSLSPCATDAAPNWAFATGVTVRGAQQHLAIVNPFPADAVVDVDLITASSRKRLEALEVRRRSQLLVKVDEVEGVLRERALGVLVRARVGRVVAQQAARFDDVRDGTGVELTLGVPTPSTDWVFPAGDGDRDVSRLVTILNPGDLDTTVDVTAAAGSAVEPRQVEVAAGAIATVDVGELVPGAGRYLVAVQSDNAGGVVVGDADVWRLGPNASGIVAAHAVDRPARRWVFAALGTEAGSRPALVAAVSGSSSATVTVRLVGDGQVTTTDPQTVAPGLPVALELPRGLAAGTAVEVRSSVPISVERVITTGTGFTRSPGIPAR